jgi:imidazolonepropionase-like amidohydrolase
MLKKLNFVLATNSHLSYTCPHDLAASVRQYAPEPRSKTAITNIRIFDGLCFTPPKTIFVDDGIITSNEGNVTTSIDATGQFLIPGLIDSYIHISSVQGLENATSYGKTTVLNMACANCTLCNLKHQEGFADFLTAGHPAVGPNTNHARFQKLAPANIVSDYFNATDLARWAFSNSSDWFKIMLEVNGPGYNLTRRLISAVHDLGQQTMSHASDVAAYTQAIETGIDGIQHTPMDGNLTAALIQQIKSNKQFVTPTMTIFAYGLDPPNPTFLNLLGGKSKPGNNTWYNVVHNVRAMYHAGIPLLAGTDSVGPIAPNVTLAFGDTLHEGMQHFVEDVDMTPVEAINAATRVAAKYHRLHDQGVIAEGMRADLVLLGKNSLEDISNTRDVVGVWVEGRRYTGVLGGKGVGRFWLE